MPDFQTPVDRQVSWLLAQIATQRPAFCADVWQRDSHALAICEQDWGAALHPS